jgi:citrate lyase beta subunit
MTRPFQDLRTAIEAAEAREAAVAQVVDSRRAGLPLRFWAQQAHLTTPAGDVDLARKALSQGTGPTARILERLSLTPADLAQALGTAEPDVVDLLENPRAAPLVMLDGEDAQALRPDVIDAGLANVADLLSESGRGPTPGGLRFFRPPGFALQTTSRDLLVLLDDLARRSVESAFPLDGIVFPKIEHPEQVDLLYGHLDAAERDLDLAPGSVRVGLLIESGWAIGNLAELARRAAPRLSSLIFGLVDFSADLRLDVIRNDHPIVDWARALIVAIAGGVGVPAIDGMTVDYPVADASLDLAANAERFLARMRLVYDDACRARALGMAGKWVGHPAQLFAVLLAFDQRFNQAQLEVETAKLAAYRQAVEVAGRGATMIGGVMSDRATDRHARSVIRQAVATGHFSPERAHAIGVISDAELHEASAGRRGAVSDR